MSLRIAYISSISHNKLAKYFYFSIIETSGLSGPGGRDGFINYKEMNMYVLLLSLFFVSSVVAAGDEGYEEDHLRERREQQLVEAAAARVAEAPQESRGRLLRQEATLVLEQEEINAEIESLASQVAAMGAPSLEELKTQISRLDYSILGRALKDYELSAFSRPQLLWLQVYLDETYRQITSSTAPQNNPKMARLWEDYRSDPTSYRYTSSHRAVELIAQALALVNAQLGLR